MKPFGHRFPTSMTNFCIPPAGIKSVDRINTRNLEWHSTCEKQAAASKQALEARARVKDDGSLCLDKPSLSTTLATSACQSGAGGSRGKRNRRAPWRAGLAAEGARGRARVTDDGSLCLDRSHQRLRPARLKRSTGLGPHCATHLGERSMGKIKAHEIHTFYSRRLNTKMRAQAGKKCRCKAPDGKQRRPSLQTYF